MTDSGTTVTVADTTYHIGYEFVGASPSWEYYPGAPRRWWTEGYVVNKVIEGDSKGEQWLPRLTTR